MFGQREFNLGLPAAAFFSMEVCVPYHVFKKGTALDSSSLLCHTADSSFADVYLGWSEQGIYLRVESRVAAHSVDFPDYDKHDAVELFFDTRDQKESSVPTKFCHHFVFLPMAVGDITGIEITKFRQEEARALCDPHALFVKTDHHSHGYRMSIFIPAHCLYGYDPLNFNRLGFTFCLRSSQREALQDFAVDSRFFNVEQRSLQWSSLILSHS